MAASIQQAEDENINQAESSACQSTTSRQIRGGFDCEFVEKPPVIQSECPVCLKVLREPHQVSCCASLFCQVCIEEVKTEKNRCPTCNQGKFSTFHDKRLQRTLYEFQVYCSHKEEGCDWKGELGQLDNHLNLSPQPDKRLEGCKYSEIECIYCSESIKRCDITIHQGEHCPKRPFSCEYCHSYKSHNEDVIHNHWPVCSYHPVHCPNECGKLPQRQALENHIARDCPKTVIDCDFRHVGCDVRLTRQDMPAHLNENLVTHMSLLAVSHSKLLPSHTVVRASQRSLRDKVNKLESENETLKSQLEAIQKEKQDSSAKVAELEHKVETLEHQAAIQNEKVATTANQVATRIQEMKEEVAKLELFSQAQYTVVQQMVKHLKIHTSNMIEITMRNFEVYKRSDSVWFSEPFYSHPGGYKLCLRVDANGNSTAKGTHVSVFACLMRGEFDDYLAWPFQTEVAIQLLSHKGNVYRQAFQYNKSTPNGNRVRLGERHENGLGCPKFISHGSLRPNYLRNDCLRFRITFTTIKI